MTDKEFDKILEQRDKEWGQLACEAWSAWTDKEREEVTLADLEADVRDTRLSIEEMRGPDDKNKKLRMALAGLGYVVDASIDTEFVRCHTEELIYAFEENVSDIDFDFWIQYEALLGVKMSYEEYVFIDMLYEGDPLELIDVELSDELKTLFGKLKTALDDFRAGKVNDDAVALLVEAHKENWTPDKYDDVYQKISVKASEEVAEAVCKGLEEEYSSRFEKGNTVDVLIEDAQEKAASYNEAKKLVEHTYGNHIFMRLEVDGEVHEVSNYAGVDGKWDTYKTTADGTDKRDAVIQAFNELY